MTAEESGLARLMPRVYKELRSLAERHLKNERPNHTLQPTALVNEAYLKLVNQPSAPWRDRVLFFAAAGQVMRRILVDHARARKSVKRFRRRVDVALDSLPLTLPGAACDFLDLDEALRALFAQAPRKARVVELRFFSGLTAEETALVLGVTTRSVERDWRYARAWLYRTLAEQAPDP